MGWLFLFAVLFLMVFLVLNSTRTRLVALGVLAFIATVVAFFLLSIDEAEQQAEEFESQEGSRRALTAKTGMRQTGLQLAGFFLVFGLQRFRQRGRGLFQHPGHRLAGTRPR